MMNNTESGSTFSILIVDDDPMIQKVGRAILEHCGCRVEVAGSGREAVDAFSRQRYDMVFMDCQMPGMDGYEATGVIREMENKNREGGNVARIPIVALTGLPPRKTGSDACRREWMIISASPSASRAFNRSSTDGFPARPGRTREGTGGQDSPGAEAPTGTAKNPPSRRAPCHRPEGPRGDCLAPAAGVG